MLLAHGHVLPNHSLRHIERNICKWRRRGKIRFPKEFATIPSAIIKAPPRNLVFCSPERDPTLNPLWTSVRDFFQILKGGLNWSLNLNYLSVQSSAHSWKLELITLLAFLHIFWYIIPVTREHVAGITAALPTSVGAASYHTSHVYMAKGGNRPTPPIPSFSWSSGPGFFVMRLTAKYS